MPNKTTLDHRPQRLCQVLCGLSSPLWYLHPQVMSSQVHSVSFLSNRNHFRGKAQRCLWRRQRNVLSQPPARAVWSWVAPQDEDSEALAAPHGRHISWSWLGAGWPRHGDGNMKPPPIIKEEQLEQLSGSEGGSVKHIDLQTSSHCGYSGGCIIYC